MSLVDDLLADLAAEGDVLRELIGDLDEAGWSTSTPAAGWDVATQVGHLAWTDEVAVLAARAHSPAGKQEWDEAVLAAIADPTGYVDRGAADLAALPPVELLARWDASRAELATALRAVPEGTKMPWFGPPMSPASMATARFMETWAHSVDVHEALGGLGPPATPRLRHVAHLGVRTRDFAFGQHGLTPPPEPFRVELVAPDGATWAWGPETAAESVRGEALQFCLLVTQRVHRDDTDLVAVGPKAAHWLTIAQAFAGPPGPGREAAS